MTEITVDATKIGIKKPIKIVRSFAMQRKAKVLQESLSKAALDSQEEFADLTKDGGFLASLKQDKSEDNKSLERLEKKYKVTSGITDPDFWDTRVNSVGNVIMVKLDGLQKFSSYGQIEEYISFIEDLADINTKKEKDKFENNEKLTTDNIIEVGQEIIGKILGIEDMEATEDDRKS